MLLKKKQILLKIKNNTEENKELNFEEFYIIGKDNTKYEPTIIVPMGIGTTAKGLRLKLKANKKRTVMIQFKPAIPKDEKVTHIMVNGNNYEINMVSKD